jgi:hypothetical protein
MTSYSSIKTMLKNFSRTIIGIALLLFLLMYLASCTSTEDETNSSVLTGSENHYIPSADLGDAFRYWNTTWLGYSSELYDEIIALTTSYFQTHKYVFGESDCNDMAVDVWQKLVDKEIISLIVVGNLEKSYETFLECNHAWLLVYSSEGSAAALDLVRGKVFIWENVRTNPQLRQYWEGFVYESPSDLLGDFKERW